MADPFMLIHADLCWVSPESLHGLIEYSGRRVAPVSRSLSFIWGRGAGPRVAIRQQVASWPPAKPPGAALLSTVDADWPAIRSRDSAPPPSCPLPPAALTNRRPSFSHHYSNIHNYTITTRPPVPIEFHRRSFGMLRGMLRGMLGILD